MAKALQILIFLAGVSLHAQDLRSEVTLSDTALNGSQTLTASVRVTNTGEAAGEFVVQIGTNSQEVKEANCLWSKTR